MSEDFNYDEEKAKRLLSEAFSGDINEEDANKYADILEKNLIKTIKKYQEKNSKQPIKIITPDGEETELDFLMGAGFVYNLDEDDNLKINQITQMAGITGPINAMQLLEELNDEVQHMISFKFLQALNMLLEGEFKDGPGQKE